jgi:hypothetical protein
VKEEGDLSPSEVIEAHQKRLESMDVIPDDMTILEMAEAIARGKIKPSQMQMRMLIELLPYYAPKLSAVAHAALSGSDFATMLDRALKRSMSGMPPSALPSPKVIEGEQVEGEG